MSLTGFIRLSTLIALSVSMMPLAAMAQEVVLPKPDAKIDATVGYTYKDSKPGVLKINKAPAHAPNVVLLLLDDVGFGAASAFGGPIPTPNLDALAKQGLRYNQFHTTALCSPTRAALLTGRNHHTVNSGSITELATGFDGYTGIIEKNTASIAEILKLNGYNTAAFGKWHNTPPWEITPAGAFDRWPTGIGFEKFYGFNGGETNQWYPALYDGTTAVEPSPDPNYHLTVDLANQATRWINLQKAANPDKPFFVYWAPGATHAPHHVPQEWIDQFKGKFDQGWDAQRILTYKNQLKMGIIPKNTKLTPRPKQIQAWESLTPEQKKVSARLMETYAAFLAHADHEAGKLVDTLKTQGLFENTLFITIVGDNGASGEGTLNGLYNEASMFNGIPEDPKGLVKKLDNIGGKKAYNHYNVGWAWAMDTPFQWTKQVASHFGGTRNGMIITWPERITDQGGLRSQFEHVIDIAPTILEAAGLPEPTEINGAPQKPMEGSSLLYTFNAPKAPSTHKVQYFEMFGNRAIYKDGWVAAVFHGRAPWDTTSSGLSFDNENWELYRIADDFSEAKNLAKQYPDKLKELQALFLTEAKAHNVLPLDDRTAERLDLKQRAEMLGGVRNTFVYYPGTERLVNVTPNFFNQSFSITSYVDMPQAETPEGMLLAVGAIEGGFAVYVKDGKLTFGYNYALSRTDLIVADGSLPSGRVALKTVFDYDGGGRGKGGKISLFANDQLIGEGRLESTLPFAYSLEGVVVDLGKDLGSPVIPDEYQGEFPFNGTLEKVVIDLGQ